MESLSNSRLLDNPQKYVCKYIKISMELCSNHFSVVSQGGSQLGSYGLARWSWTTPKSMFVSIIEITWNNLTKSMSAWVSLSNVWQNVSLMNCYTSMENFKKYFSSNAKTHKSANNSATTGARVKISTHLEYLEFFTIFYVCFTKLSIKFYLVKIVTDFQWQPICLVGESTSLHPIMLHSLQS